jgi:hypothetical protein
LLFPFFCTLTSIEKQNQVAMGRNILLLNYQCLANQCKSKEQVYFFRLIFWLGMINDKSSDQTEVPKMCA